MAGEQAEINLLEILNEEDIGKKINALAIIADHNRLTLIGHTAALTKLETKCENNYTKRERVINYGSAGTAIGALIVGIITFIQQHFTLK